MKKSIYDLFNELEKEQICEIVFKAISRVHKIDRSIDLDFDVIYEWE